MQKDYPKADDFLDLHSLTKGYMDPEGVTLHYTADIDQQRVIDTLISKSLGYHLILTRGGSVVQLADLNQKLWHAGNADWNGLSPNRKHIAVAVMSWGLLTKKDGDFISWTGKPVDSAQVIEKNKHYWHKITFPQFMRLLEVCFWLYDRGIKAHQFCGHDECARPSGRKIDPGGTLGIDMSTLRSILSQRMISVS